jgi:L-asparagine oxygenase
MARTDASALTTWSSASTSASRPTPSPVDDAFVRAANHSSLPGAIEAELRAFAADPGDAGTLLLRHMPVGRVPATPAGPGTDTGKDTTSERTLMAVGSRLGEPVGYVQEHGGGLVQDIVPARRDVGRQLSTSSDVTLEWHTETAFHPHKPRYVLLLCLRGDAGARTLCCSIADVLPHLDGDTVATLHEPRFRTRPDASFLEPGVDGDYGPPMAVLAGADGDERASFTYDEDLMVGTDPAAQRALDALGAAVRERATSVVLEAGDLLVIDNDRVVHARSPFRARFDGSDRWLQRAFVVTDLAPSAGERDGRIITTRF